MSTKKTTPAPSADEAQELTAEEQAAWQRCIELQARIDELEAHLGSMPQINLADPQAREDLLAVRTAIEEAIPMSRYLSGNQVEGCKRFRDIIDTALALPLPEQSAADPVQE